MPFLLEILDFFKNQKNKIDDVLKKDFEKKTLIFAIAFGITVWSQMLKAAGVGDNLGFLGLLIGILITSSLVGLGIFYFFSFILSRIIELFGFLFCFQSCQNLYICCFSPFLVSAILTLVEFAIGGVKVYTKNFLMSPPKSGFLAVFSSITSFSVTFISIFCVFILTKLLSNAINCRWWKSLAILIISDIVTMLPLFLLIF